MVHTTFLRQYIPTASALCRCILLPPLPLNAGHYTLNKTLTLNVLCISLKTKAWWCLFKSATALVIEFQNHSSKRLPTVFNHSYNGYIVQKYSGRRHLSSVIFVFKLFVICATIVPLFPLLLVCLQLF